MKQAVYNSLLLVSVSSLTYCLEIGLTLFHILFSMGVISLIGSGIDWM